MTERSQSVPVVSAECGRLAPPDARGWRAFLVGIDDEMDDEETVVVYCPECEARELLAGAVSHLATSTGAAAIGTLPGMDELGVRVHLRDVRTFDLCDVTAPEPVEAGDLVASAEHVYRVEVVLLPPPGAPVVPVLVRPVELRMSTYA
jgi:hypothetical protein